MPDSPTEPLKKEAEPTNGVDLETRFFINKIIGILGLITAAIGIIGEFAGWWNDIGIVLTVSGLVATLYSAMDTNGKAALAGHATTHANLRLMRDDQRSMLAKQDRMIDGLDRIATILDERLPPST